MPASRPGLPTRGPHVFVAPFGDADRLRVDGDAGTHLASALRVRTGDEVSLADGTGAVFQAVVVDRDRGAVEVQVGSRHEVPEPATRITVVQALPKGRKMDEVVQRLTEVGVDRLRPVVTARTVKQVDGKADRVLQRWRAIAVAAAEQSRRARPMVVDPVAAWPPADAVGLVLWEDAEVPLADALAGLLADRPDGVAELTLGIGPEGGLEPREVEASGLRPCAVGPTILRTETAGIVAATLAGHHLGRYG